MIWCTGIPGTGLLTLAVLAQAVGIDHDAAWSSGRILIAGSGFILLSTAIVIGLFPRIYHPPMPAARARPDQLPVLERPLANHPGSQALSGQNPKVSRLLPGRQAALLATGLVLLGALAYLWYASAGRSLSSIEATNYFDLQAQGYLQGELSLPVQPDPRLLAVANPYDYRTRGELPVFWDASFYRGKYYLYWGPTPALVALGIKLIRPVQVPDSTLVIIFEIATLIFGALILAGIRRRLFPSLPGWIILPPLLMLGFANPVLYVLNRPSVYEAAITGGQAFLIAGLFFAWWALEVEPARVGRLALAGACWAFAAGSRQDLLPAIGLLSLGTAATLLVASPQEARLRAVLVLGIPLALGGLGLAGYNLARFGSILETGHRYQLTGPALPAGGGQVISPGYLLPNLYSYLFRPYEVSTIFPFITAPWVKESQWPFFIHLPPAYYYSEPVTGILWTLPFGVFALAPALIHAWPLVWSAVRGEVAWAPLPSPLPAGGRRLFRWLFFSLAGAVILVAGLLFIYISASMRYELDLLPGLAILAGLGFTYGYQALSLHSRAQRLYLIAGMITTAYLVAAGLLFGFSGYNNHFEAVNPGLYYGLTHFLRLAPLP